MLLLLLVASQHSLHNNIVIMCVISKQTRNRDNEMECDETWTRKGLLHVVATCSATFAEFCALNSMHGICTGAYNHSCIRSVHVRSMQWTHNVSSVQKGFHPESDLSHPQSAGLGRTRTGVTV